MLLSFVSVPPSQLATMESSAPLSTTDPEPSSVTSPLIMRSGSSFELRQADDNRAPIMNIADQRQRSAFIDKDVAAAGDSYVLQRAVAARRLNEAATTGLDRAAGDGRVVKVHNAIVARFDRAAGNRRICQDDRRGAAQGCDQTILIVDIGRVEGDGAAVRFDRAEIRAAVFDIDDEGVLVGGFDRAVVFQRTKRQRAGPR